ncbi:MAG: RNA 2',3'-cyclic phosphodiesterase [Hyphomicrobiaceae bacterium]
MSLYTCRLDLIDGPMVLRLDGDYAIMAPQFPVADLTEEVLMPRLFTAIPIPEDIRADLSLHQEPLAGARWLASEDYHLTLRFIGDVDNPMAREFADFLSRIEINVFDMRLVGFDAFGGNEPRTLWAGIEADQTLRALQRANETAARAAGLKPEKQQFRPHVTVARLRHARVEALSKYLERHGGYRSSTFVVDHFVLLSSKPRSGGGPYVVEERFPLVAGEWDNLEDAQAIWAGEEETGGW